METLMHIGTLIKGKLRTTFCMSNGRQSANVKVITLNKLFGNRTVKCLLIPHYA